MGANFNIFLEVANQYFSISNIRFQQRLGINDKNLSDERLLLNQDSL